MKIMVCMSNVRDAATKIAFTNNNTQFNTTGSQFISNPYYALSPRTEHVAQTGISISANLYIAIEIPGVKTSLAKINSSKNKTTEAPFFSYDFDLISRSVSVKKVSLQNKRICCDGQ